MFDWVGDLLNEFLGWLASLLPDWLGSGWDGLAASFGPIAKYFAYLGGLDVVAPTVMSAYVIKFLIRRIPVIG